MSLASRTFVNNASEADIVRNCSVFVSHNYSADLHMLAISLISKAPPIQNVVHMLANHALDELDITYAMNDLYRSTLEVEYDCGRALRLLLKLGFINERPEVGMNRQWSETGDCYVLKLFRDYVFHQADEAGKPVIDIGHVVTSLNKLDCGDSEKITLISRDGKAILVVSYGDVARCLENAYNDLCTSSSKEKLAFNQR